MAFDIASYLWNQSIRLQRNDWKQNAQLLGDEMYTILSNIQRPPLPPVQTDENGNPIVFPELPDIPGVNIPPWDIPENPFNPPTQPPPTIDGPTDPQDPVDPGDGGSTFVTQRFWHRSVHPGLLTSGNTGANFSCSLYHNGLQQQPTAVTATITDPTLAADMEAGTWVDVHLIVQYEAISETTGNSTFPTRLQALSVEYLFVPTGSGSGGRWGVTATTIQGKTGSQPGSGTVLLKKKDPQSGQWVDDVEATVYTTVPGSTPADKDVQMKRIAGDLFLDVEDCGGDEED